MAGKTIGYARTSTVAQDIRPQIEALKAAGCTDIYADRGISGGTLNRPGLQQARAALQPGDTLKVCNLDCISRFPAELSAFRAELRKEGIHMIELSSPTNTLVESIIDLRNIIEAESIDSEDVAQFSEFTGGSDSTQPKR